MLIINVSGSLWRWQGTRIAARHLGHTPQLPHACLNAPEAAPSKKSHLQHTARGRCACEHAMHQNELRAEHSHAAAREHTSACYTCGLLHTYMHMWVLQAQDSHFTACMSSPPCGLLRQFIMPYFPPYFPPCTTSARLSHFC